MSEPFDPNGPVVLVTVQAWGPRGHGALRLALDTGATSTILSRQAAVFLGYDVAGAERTVELVTASGLERAPQVAMSRIRALGHERRQFPVLCHTLPARAIVDGLLGLDFLRGRRLGVDFREGLLTLD